MAKELLPDALWLRIAPLLPPDPPKPKGRRPRVSSPRTAWAATGGWSNGRSPGSTASGA